MTQNERLRALLQDAREELYSLGESFAESSAAGCDGSAERYAREARYLHARIDAALAEPGDVHPSNLTDVVTLLENDRDAARAEIERLKALGALQSADIQRLANRVAQGEADWAALRTEAATAYRRGAEAMREAAARAFDSPQMAGGSGVLMGHKYVANSIRVLPIPEDKR